MTWCYPEGANVEADKVIPPIPTIVPVRYLIIGKNQSIL